MAANESGPSLQQVELRHLIALRAVAEARSFGRAAETLGYTQSAVSQQIAALERIVGEPLFDRPGGPKPVEITSAGEILLEHADAIVERVRAAEADLAGYRAGEVGRVAIGTFQSVSVEVLPHVIHQLRADRPDVEIKLLEEDEQDVLMKALGAGDLDLTFCVGPVADGPWDFVPLAVDPFVVISPAGEPLSAAGEPVPAATLDGLPIIGQSPSSCQLIIEDGMREIGAEPNVFFRTADNSAVQAMVRSGMGHSVTARLAIDADDPGICVRDVDPPLRPRTIGIALPHRTRAPIVDTVVDIAREVCERIMPAADLVS